MRYGPTGHGVADKIPESGPLFVVVRTLRIDDLAKLRMRLS